ncbi:MAG: CPBP family intramembrane metalloprotease [Gammaproteobacteria bacterium]|nr:CPBP family intramembrane metalloprotease [Gammaproteobacteria bacterium]
MIHDSTKPAFINITRQNVSYYFSQFLKSSYLLLAVSLIFYAYSKDVLIIYAKYFGIFNIRNIPGMLFFSMYSLLWLGILPIAFNKWIRRETLYDIGIALPNNRLLAILLIIVALSLLIPFMIFFATQNTFQSYAFGGLSTFQFIFIITFLFPLYYIGEECFIRGFLFLGLWKRVGWHSFWITDILFTLFHIGKPIPEVLLCIPASVIFNCLTLFTRSVIPAIIVHSTMGAVLSILVTYHWLGHTV